MIFIFKLRFIFKFDDTLFSSYFSKKIGIKWILGKPFLKISNILDRIRKIYGFYSFIKKGI